MGTRGPSQELWAESGLHCQLGRWWEVPLLSGHSWLHLKSGTSILTCHDAVDGSVDHLCNCQRLSDPQLCCGSPHRTWGLSAASQGSLALGPHSRTPVLLSLSFALTSDFKICAKSSGLFVPNHEVGIQLRLPSLHDGTSENHRPSEHAGTKYSFRCGRQAALRDQVQTNAIQLRTSIQSVQRPPPHLARTVHWAFLGVFWAGVTESY